MTTDSLKSFITLPTTTIYGRQKSENTKFILLSSFVLIFSIGISSYVIWSSIRMTELRDELNGLRGKLEDLRKRMGLDLLDDLHDFEEAHELPQHRQGFEDFSNSVDDLDDEDYSIDDLTMDDDDDGENLKEGSGIFKMFPDDDEYDNESIYDEIRKSRKPRAIPPHEGVPVIEESYAMRRNRTNTPADDMVMNVLLNRHQNPKLKYDWGQKQWEGNERRQHNVVHRRPPRRYQSFSASPTQFVDKDVTLTIRESDANPQRELNIRHRNHHHLSTQPNLQEHVAAPEQRVYRRQFGNSAERKKKSHGNKSRTIAIHYEGDESKYRLLTAHHYKENSLLHHVTGNYDYWKPSAWAVESGMENFFVLEDGGVTVKESGVYLIYAQIYYNDKRDSYSFTIRRNGSPILLCEVTSRNNHSHDAQNKNTCYTSGVVFLQADDRIQVKSGENQHYVLFHPHTSFFGLVKLGALGGHHGGHLSSTSGANLISHDESRRTFS